MDIETATAEPISPISCTIEARGLRVTQDKPTELGGHDEGMMASELLLSSLLACQLSTFYKVAKKRGKEVRAIRIKGDLEFDDASDISAIRLHWTLNADDGTDTLLKLTDRVCTISRALKVPVSWTYEISAPAAKARSR